ncbi:MAG: DMT family transporter [Firmicutes bacterium]|nr:DMT family transporter [Bacillota bacterium]
MSSEALSSHSSKGHALAALGAGLLAVVWGGSFAAMKYLLNSGLSVGSVLTVRFFLGAGCLWLLAKAFRVPFTRQAVRDGLVLGFWLTLVFWLQTDGLRFTTTTKSGFITGLYVLFTPAVSILFRERFGFAHGLGALVAALGLYFLVHEPGAPFGGWNWGDTETLLCAVGCGFHIVLTTRFSRRSSGWVLATMQVAVVAVVSLVITALLPAPHGFQNLLKPLSQPQVWVAMAYLSLLATVLAFWGMSTFQAYLGATEAAILYSMEPVYAALIAMAGLVPGVQERLAPSQIFGGLLLFSAMVLAELGPRWWKKERPS